MFQGGLRPFLAEVLDVLLSEGVVVRLELFETGLVLDFLQFDLLGGLLHDGDVHHRIDLIVKLIVLQDHLRVVRVDAQLVLEYVLSH